MTFAGSQMISALLECRDHYSLSSYRSWPDSRAVEGRGDWKESRVKGRVRDDLEFWDPPFLGGWDCPNLTLNISLGEWIRGYHYWELNYWIVLKFMSRIIKCLRRNEFSANMEHFKSTTVIFQKKRKALFVSNWLKFLLIWTKLKTPWNVFNK